jgi:hypothetical protein
MISNNRSSPYVGWRRATSSSVEDFEVGVDAHIIGGGASDRRIAFAGAAKDTLEHFVAKNCVRIGSHPENV